ncbi:hypothetical protein JOQ06_002940 [Pogonophryne albipinna]|uniref:Uncharacterized protein n=1 Tax=Pogonophryne albipinna TaxID=1090488 RepID=A0AAD6B8T5_9TELE|nr:hypothetical protein JOQ06_002940 [Pogonophryne albipinna]
MAEHWYRTSMGRANNFSKASSDVSIVTPPCPLTVSSLSRVHEPTGPSLKQGVTVRERQHQPYPNEPEVDNQQRLSSTQNYQFLLQTLVAKRDHTLNHSNS